MGGGAVGSLVRSRRLGLLPGLRRARALLRALPLRLPVLGPGPCGRRVRRRESRVLRRVRRRLGAGSGAPLVQQLAVPVCREGVQLPGQWEEGHRVPQVAVEASGMRFAAVQCPGYVAVAEREEGRLCRGLHESNAVGVLHLHAHDRGG